MAVLLQPNMTAGISLDVVALPTGSQQAPAPAAARRRRARLKADAAAAIAGSSNEGAGGEAAGALQRGGGGGGRSLAADTAGGSGSSSGAAEERLDALVTSALAAMLALTRADVGDAVLAATYSASIGADVGVVRVVYPPGVRGAYRALCAYMCVYMCVCVCMCLSVCAGAQCSGVWHPCACLTLEVGTVPLATGLQLRQAAAAAA